MPRVPYPDPLYPVVWADTPDAPDSSPTPAGGAAPPHDDDPFQLHLDEARVRQADNDAVDQWKALSGPWFATRGGEAATRWREIEQALGEIVYRPLGSLETERQRRMYRDIMAPRLEAWGDEARAHAEREARAFNEEESQRRQDLALAAMRRGARLGDMRAVAEGERRLVGEMRGRSRRQGLDADAASAAETDALGAAHSDVVEHLAQHNPQQAQDWLNAQAGMIRDPAKMDRLNRMLQPYVAEQQQEGLAGQIRSQASNLSAQHAAVDAMGLDPVIADGLKQRLADMAESDRETSEAEHKAAADRIWASVLDPATRSLRGISPSDYDLLRPGEQESVRAALAAKLRGEEAAPEPLPYSRQFAVAAAQGDDEGQLPGEAATGTSPAALASLAPLRLASADGAIPSGATIGGQLFTVNPPGTSSPTAVPIDQWSTLDPKRSERQARDDMAIRHPGATHDELVKMINDEALAALKQQNRVPPPTGSDTSSTPVGLAPARPGKATATAVAELTGLTLEQQAYLNAMRSGLWRQTGRDAREAGGLKDDKAVKAAMARAQAMPDKKIDLGVEPAKREKDVKDATDFLNAVRVETARAKLGGGYPDLEKLIVLARNSKGQAYVKAIATLGAQGGYVQKFDADDVIAIAHVHSDPGLQQPPNGADDSWMKATGKPSFVISADGSRLWEIGRENKDISIRSVGNPKRPGRWEKFQGRAADYRYNRETAP